MFQYILCTTEYYRNYRETIVVLCTTEIYIMYHFQLIYNVFLQYIFSQIILCLNAKFIKHNDLQLKNNLKKFKICIKKILII